VSSVEVEVSDGIGLVALNRPERLNAVDPELVERLVTALDAVTDADVGAVVLFGNGRAFSAGHDLKAPPSDPATLPARLQRIQDVTRRIRACPAPVIAAVHGHAVGAGAEFALGCDLVLAAEGTRFRFPEVELGLSATGGLSTLLPLLVGPVRAKELVLFGDPVEAVEAVRLGLVNAVLPAEELLPTARRWAARLAALPRLPVAMAKRALDAGSARAVSTALGREVEQAIAIEVSGAGASAEVLATRARAVG
jgi:enoyl-CoA hydratase/carnithine racemase